VSSCSVKGSKLLVQLIMELFVDEKAGL